MSDEETATVYEELKKKYPGMTTEALADIMRTGAEKGLIQVGQEQAEKTGEPQFDIIKALKDKDMDLDSIMRFMIVDQWMRERFKGKEIPKELQDIIEKAKQGDKGAVGDLDALMDRMMKYEMIESFMDGRRGRKQQPTNGVDVEKVIREVGDKMAEALKTHKLEDEKTRAEERAKLLETQKNEAEKKLAEHVKTEQEEQKFQERLQASVDPLKKEYDRRIAEITSRLQNVPAEERKGLVFDLGEMISEELGKDIKERIVEGLKDAFGGGGSPPVDSKGNVDWYKLGERGLKTLEKFIEKLPTQAPAKREVKELPKLPPRTSIEATAPAETASTSEKSIIKEKPKETVKSETSTNESAVASESGEKS